MASARKEPTPGLITRSENEPRSSLGGSPKEESESFGAWLRRHRELREITLREIADTSKISLRYLQALEDDRFELLPAPVFAKGFLRQYARYVGIDPEEAVNFYLSADGLSDEEPEEEVSSPRRPKAVGTWPYAVAVVVAAVVLMGIVWVLRELNRGPDEASARTGVLAADLPAASSVAAEASGEAPTAEAAESGVPISEEPGVASQPGEATPGRAAPGRAAAHTGQTEAEPPESLFVTLDFRDDCWVRATVDGETREDRVYTQGESLQLFADELVELELGNAFAVDVEVEGHPMDLDHGSKNPVRRVSIDRETAAALERGGAR